MSLEQACQRYNQPCSSETLAAIHCEWSCLRTWSTWKGELVLGYVDSRREAATTTWDLQEVK